MEAEISGSPNHFMQCPYCHSRNTNSAAACAVCGSPLSLPQVGSANQQSQPPEQSSRRPHSAQHAAVAAQPEAVTETAPAISQTLPSQPLSSPTSSSRSSAPPIAACTPFRVMQITSPDEICGAAFWRNETDEKLVIVSKKGEATLWNANGEQSAILLDSSNKARNATCVQLYPDINLVVTGHENGAIHIRSTSTRSSQIVQAHGSGVAALSYAPDTQCLVSASSDGSVVFWQLSDEPNGVKASAQAPFDTFCGITALALSPDATLLAIGDDAGTTSVWDARRQAVIWSHSPHRLCVTALAFSPNGNALAGASLDGTACLWASRNGFQLHGWNQSQNSDNFSADATTSGVGALTALAFSPSGRQLALGHRNGIVSIYDARTQQLLSHIRTLSEVRQLIFSKNEDFLLIAASHQVCLWRLMS